MIFDIKTLILLLLAIATINMGALWLLWLNNRRRFAGISFWLADMMCQFAGAGLILVRGRVPDFLSVVVANTFVISGALLLLIGLERFTGKQRRQGWNYVAAAAAPVLLTYFLFVQPSLKVREIVISAALLLFAAQASWLLLRRVSPSLRPVTRLTGLVLAGYAAVSLTRISLHLVIPAQTNDFFQTGLVNSLAMTFYIMLNVSLTISLIAMVNRRLVEQILAQEEKYARVFRSAPYAVTLTSLPTGQIFEVNDGFVQMSGYTGDEIVGKTMLDLNVWANPEDRNSLLEGLVAQGHLPAREVQFRRKSGELLTGLISAQVIVVNDEPCVMSSISDISERKQMENDLRASEELLSTMGSLAKVGGWGLDLKTNQLTWTRETYRIHEVEPDFRLELDSAINFYAPSARPVIQKAIERALTEDLPFDLELPFITAKGNHLWVRAIGNVDREDGQAARVYGVFQDITERKQAEEQITRSNMRLQKLVNILKHPAESVQQFLDYALAEAIELTESKIGYIYHYHEDRQEFVLNTWSKEVMPDCDVVNPQTCYELDKTGIWGEAVRQRRPIIVNDFQANHALKKGLPDGHVRLTSFMTTPIWRGQQIVGVIGLANKATDYQEDDVFQVSLLMDAVWSVVERKQAVEALRISEIRHRLLAENARDVVWVNGLDGSMTYVSPSVEQMRGVKPAESLQQPLEQILTPASQAVVQAYYQNLWAAVEAGLPLESFRGELEYIHKDGSTIWAEVMAFPILSPSGGFVEILGVSRDIRERKRAEEELRQANAQLAAQTAHASQMAAQAEAANRAKSQFLASISHELRTPLNAILGFSELMARDANLTAKQHENLAIINRSGDHLLALINDVLDMARIEAGRTVLQEGDFNLHHLLEDIADLFRLRAESKGISLTLTVWPGLPRWVHADQGKLRQILINLLSNAVKFTPSGRIDLSAQRTGGDDDRLLIAVQDTGSGILPADLTAIFEPFVQSANGHNAPDGTGLGLPISQQFARLMGGDLTAFSAGIPGEGSRFEVVLPLRLAVADGETGRPLADRPRTAFLAPGQPDYRLLVAEDHAESRELLAGLLTQLGFAVRTAGNGQEAIQVWEEWQPHLIWMDMRMPALDGHETTRRIKATAQGQQTVIVAISAGVLSDKHAAMRADGCDDFVGKPYRAEEIVACLVRHLGVQMVYADAPSVTPAAAPPAIDLTALPDGWAAQVRQAALAADAGQLLALAAEVEAAQPELAAALRRSIDDFDYDAILETGGIMMDRPLFHSLSTT